MIKRRPDLAILALGLVLRLGWALAVPVVPISDSSAYDTFATNLATCGTFGWTCDQPTAYWPPGTSYLYSVLFRVFGHGYAPIVALNLLFFVATTWLAMTLARRWFDDRVALVAGLALALWPSQIQFTTVLASEQPFTFALLAGIALASLRSRPWWPASIAAGIVFGAACLVRPTALLVPAVLAGAEALRTRELRAIVPRVLVLYVALFAAVAPWAARNTRVFGRFVLVSTNGGTNLWMGNHEGTNGVYAELPKEADALGNEALRDEVLGAEAKRFIRRHPLQFVGLTARRLVTTHSRESVAVGWNQDGLTARFGARVLTPLKLLNLAYWLPALGLGIAGIVLLVRRKGWREGLLTPPALLWIYFAGVHAIVVAQDRYHFPCIPFIAALAAWALVHFRAKPRSAAA